MSPGSERPRSFDDVAATLRRELVDHIAPDLVGPAGWRTVDTNSTLAERRGRIVATLACERLGVDSLAGTRLADLGCGVGSLAALFAFEGARVVAVDRNRPRLEIAERVAAAHGLDIGVVACPMERLDLPDATFDVAVMNNSLVYLVEPDARQRALAEARRVLRPGGVLVTRNANRLHPIDQFTGLPLLHLLPPASASRLARLAGRPRSHCRPRSPRGGSRELAAAGFVEIEHRPRRPIPSRYTHHSALRPR